MGGVGMVYLDDGKGLQVFQAQAAGIKAGAQDDDLMYTLADRGFQQLVNEAGAGQPRGQGAGDTALDITIKKLFGRWKGCQAAGEAEPEIKKMNGVRVCEKAFVLWSSRLHGTVKGHVLSRLAGGIGLHGVKIGCAVNRVNEPGLSSAVDIVSCAGDPAPDPAERLGRDSDVAGKIFQGHVPEQMRIVVHETQVPLFGIILQERHLPPVLPDIQFLRRFAADAVAYGCIGVHLLEVIVADAVQDDVGQGFGLIQYGGACEKGIVGRRKGILESDLESDVLFSFLHEIADDAAVNKVDIVLYGAGCENGSFFAKGAALHAGNKEFPIHCRQRAVLLQIFL